MESDPAVSLEPRMNGGDVGIAAENARFDVRRFEPRQKVGRAFSAARANDAFDRGIRESPEKVGQSFLVRTGELQTRLHDVLAEDRFESERSQRGGSFVELRFVHTP